MNRPKKPKRSSQKSPGIGSAEEEVVVPIKETIGPTHDQSQFPAPWVRNVLSIGAVVHLVAVAASFFGVVEPSETHSAILAKFAPYLRVTHFGADDRPVYLAHADSLEQPHRLQILRPGFDPPWQTIQPDGIAGLASSDRYARWVGTMARLAESDQPGLVATMLLPEIEQIVSNDPSRPITQVRIIRLPTELTNVTEDAAPPPYVAAVVFDDRRIDLVQVKDERLNARAAANGDTPTGDAGGDVNE